MDNKYIILRYGEIFLKGKNQRFFEKKLIENVKSITGVSEVLRLRGRLVVPFFEGFETLKNVFGISSYSIATKCGKNLEEIKKIAVKICEGLKGTFRIETKRSDKTFPVKSPEVNVQVGTFVEEHSNLTFKLKEPDTVVHVEINQDGVYLFIEKVKCHGGLPTGVEGEVTLLVENDASLLAGLLFMKRGCSVKLVVLEDIDVSLLEKYSPKKLDVITLPTKHVLVSGETFETYRKSEQNIFRPLIGFTKEEIAQKLEQYTF